MKRLERASGKKVKSKTYQKKNEDPSEDSEVSGQGQFDRKQKKWKKDKKPKSQAKRIFPDHFPNDEKLKS